MIKLYTKVGSKIFQRPDPFFQFPGGEWHMKDDGKTFVGDEAAVIVGADPNDYVKLMLWQNACKEFPRIVIPYLPAARADKGTPRGADVYANLIPEYKRLVVLDAHSDYMVDYLRDVRGSDVVNIPITEVLPKNPYEYNGVIAPDEGAAERASSLAAHWGVPFYQASKVRDFETGKLLEFNPPKNLPKSGRFLLADDICDGGGTFVGLSEAVDFDSPCVRLHLYVSHGIFSQGVEKVKNHFFRVITTDSLPQDDPNITVVPILDHLLRRVYQ